MGRFTIRNSELILAMPVSIYETVKAALENDDRQSVKDIEADLNKWLNPSPSWIFIRNPSPSY
jgi:phage-related protein